MDLATFIDIYFDYDDYENKFSPKFDFTFTTKQNASFAVSSTIALPKEKIEEIYNLITMGDD
jgi:hypothetical protein